MEKFPFTSPGAADKIAELYAAPGPVREEAANKAESNFKNWLNDSFELSPEQQDYLEEVSDTLTDHWGSSTAFFIRNMLPIELIRPEQRPKDRSSKLVLSDEELRELDGPRATEGEPGFEGILRFTITY